MQHIESAAFTKFVPRLPTRPALTGGSASGRLSIIEAKLPGRSISPRLMSHRQAIQRLSAMLPLRHEAVHQGDKAIVVRWFKQMHHFVNHDVLQAFGGLLSQIRIQSDASDFGAAAPPFCLHPLHIEPDHFDAQHRFPTSDDRRNCLTKLLSIPGINNCAPLSFRCARPHSET